MNYRRISHHHQESPIRLLDERSAVVKSGKMANLRLELEDFLFEAKKEGRDRIVLRP
jgi:hypothetical protein